MSDSLPDATGGSSGPIRFHLFVAGATSRTHRALENLRRLTEGDLQGRCEVEIIDVITDPDRAEEERILATPTLIKSSPGPTRRITGDLSDVDKVLRTIGIPSAEPTDFRAEPGP